MRIRIIKSICLTTLFLGIAVMASAQSANIRRGDALYADRAYARSLKFYLKAYEKDSTNVDLLRRLGDVCYRTGNISESVLWYSKLVQKEGSQPDDLLAYAKALKENGSYDESAFWLMQHNELVGPDEESIAFSQQLTDIVSLFRDSASFEIKQLNINTGESDMSPVIMDNKLVFCSSGLQLKIARKSYLDDEPYLKLYVADVLDDGVLGEPKIFAPALRSRFHDGPVGYARKADVLFITHNSVGKKQGGRKELINLKIQKSKCEAGRWNCGVDLPFNSSRWSVAHPATNPDGTMVIFVSNNPAGYGGTDLYITRLERGGWISPQNLGPEINTPGDELFPYLDGDGVLYFSSDGRGGLGGLDIFRSKAVVGIYGAPENMGSPVNSSADDFGIALTDDGSCGYFSSNRGGGVGKDDLYFFRRKLVHIPVQFVVRDSEKSKAIGLAKLTVFSLKGDTVAEGSTDSDGLLRLELPEGETYRIETKQPGYLNGEQDLMLSAADRGSDLIVPVKLQHNSDTDEVSEHPLYLDMEEGQPLQVLDVLTIHYDLAKWILRADAYPTLDPIIAYLNEHPDLELRIESHADCRGSRELNQKLSDKRAQILNNYFISRYIRPERIRHKGFGESRLLNICVDNVNCSEDEHAVNRRSVIKIVRKGAYDGMRLKRSAFYF